MAPPETQGDGHHYAACYAGREEPAGVGDLNKGSDHYHRTPKQTQPTFYWNSVNSDSWMWSHRWLLQSAWPGRRLVPPRHRTTFSAFLGY